MLFSLTKSGHAIIENILTDTLELRAHAVNQFLELSPFFGEDEDDYQALKSNADRYHLQCCYLQKLRQHGATITENERSFALKNLLDESEPFAKIFGYLQAARDEKNPRRKSSMRTLHLRAYTNSFKEKIMRMENKENTPPVARKL